MRAAKETPVGDKRMQKRRSPQGAFGEDRFLLCFGQIRCKCGRRDPLNPGARLPHTSLKNAPPIRSIGGAELFQIAIRRWGRAAVCLLCMDFHVEELASQRNIFPGSNKTVFSGRERIEAKGEATGFLPRLIPA